MLNTMLPPLPPLLLATKDFKGGWICCDGLPLKAWPIAILIYIFFLQTQPTNFVLQTVSF